MKFIKKLYKITLYVFHVSLADHYRVKKNFTKALKYTEKSERITGRLHPEDLLKRSFIYLRLEEYAKSVEDTKSFINLLNDSNNNLSSNDKAYLHLYAGKIGGFAQVKRDCCLEENVDDVFKLAIQESFDKSMISKHYLMHFPIK